MKKRGFSLIELAVSATVLTVALAACFGLFEWGSRVFLLSHGRAGLQGEARRAELALVNELRRADIASLTLVNSTVSPSRQVVASDGSLVERDAYSVLSLDRWDLASNFDQSTSQPLWNRYAVVYATSGNPGTLVRQYYKPAGAPYSGPLSTVTSLLNNNPLLNAGASSPQVLGQSVFSFTVTNDANLKTMRLSLVLAVMDARKGEGRLIKEKLESTFTTRLENSGP